MPMCEYQVKVLTIEPNPFILGLLFSVQTLHRILYVPIFFALFYGICYSCYDFVFFFIFPLPSCIIYFYAVCVSVLSEHLRT